jgi:hypothetical protein
LKSPPVGERNDATRTKVGLQKNFFSLQVFRNVSLPLPPLKKDVTNLDAFKNY